LIDKLPDRLITQTKITPYDGWRPKLVFFLIAAPWYYISIEAEQEERKGSLWVQWNNRCWNHQL